MIETILVVPDLSERVKRICGEMKLMIEDYGSRREMMTMSGIAE